MTHCCQTSRSHEVLESTSNMGRPVPFHAHVVANQLGQGVVADIDRKRGPIGVDERNTAAGAHHPRHLDKQR